MTQILSNNVEIILASGSPRRRAFFQDLGLQFRVVTANIEEIRKSGESSETYTRRLAMEKAADVSGKYPDQWIVAADTVVCCDDRILEKPVDAEAAVQMLLLLRNREHVVCSSICLMHGEQSVTEVCSVSTTVEFWDFSEKIVRKYVETKEPFDKAGAYGIQGKGAFLVRGIKGSYSNVVGLPLVECVEMLMRNGIVRT
jgi:nucleoside triphosphate pyrophosphatase